MFELVLEIQASELKDRIVGITSMNTLMLSVNPPIDPQKEALHIRYYPKEELWSFVYYFAPFSLTRFSRTYPGEQGIEKFHQFIHWTRW
ncbi:hypothetical protein [Apibacter sp. HY039]|uniref:hypothetical protein n=1 Tax=Apibacter sp. HY039 TaxID=2501476 RepID=UPI000FEBE644|nr:hypothetical protein [Apibacter sp. HY039]